MSQAFYGFPEEYREDTLNRIPEEMNEVYQRFAVQLDKGNEIKIMYAEPDDYIPKEIRKKYKIGEYARDN